ncbi:hypothetical protein M513_06292 [Trichuris suis]|uniref:Kazal-like domain-containing protein n=1 Tax=Trichuris suis TaxID=68888 RepID=A0A085M6F5_9BILA|nr:hypothetical protein M513_06292 [Trichuris suis]
MKSVALLLLFAILFQQGVEIKAKAMLACMKEDCKESFDNASPCLKNNKESGCKQKFASYMQCMNKCNR